MRSSKSNSDKLYSLQVLGLTNERNNIKESQNDFNDQLTQRDDGNYKARLPWKHEHPFLPSNKEWATAWLLSTTKRLDRIWKLAEFNEVFQDYLQEGILEEVQGKPTGEGIHYIPHQAVIRENAQ